MGGEALEGWMDGGWDGEREGGKEKGCESESKSATKSESKSEHYLSVLFCQLCCDYVLCRWSFIIHNVESTILCQLSERILSRYFL